jgi:hypothetical protein
MTSAQVMLSSINVGQRQWRAAAFIQDEFKVTPKLTLNLGVRSEFDEPWMEQNNKTGNLDLVTGTPIYAVSVHAGAPAGSGVCPTRACYEPNHRQIMPIQCDQLLRGQFVGPAADRVASVPAGREHCDARSDCDAERDASGWRHATHRRG